MTLKAQVIFFDKAHMRIHEEEGIYGDSIEEIAKEAGEWAEDEIARLGADNPNHPIYDWDHIEITIRHR